MSENPYEAPSANLTGQIESSDAEKIRHENLKHEASVKSIGLFYYVGGALSIFAGLAMLLTMFTDTSDLGEFGSLFYGLGIVYAGLGTLALIAGRGLRKLASWVKVPVGIVSGIGLLGFPVGTLINGYILYLVFSKKGETVLSEDYKEVIAHTPHIKYKTPIYIWILLAVIVSLAVLGVVMSTTNG